MLRCRVGNVLAHRVYTLVLPILSSPATETEYDIEYTMARASEILQIHYMWRAALEP